MSTRTSQILDFARRRGPTIALELTANFLLPFLIYSGERARLGDVRALLLASAPPIAWSLIEFARKRRIDAVSMLVLAGIALSLLAFFGGGSARFLQLREQLVTGLIGLIFLGSAAIGRPLIFQLARAGMQRRSPSEAQSFEALRDNAAFRRTMTLMTLVWGFGLLIECALASALVFAMSISAFLVVSPILGYGTMGLLGGWSFLYGRRQQRLGAARRAAAEAETTAKAEPAP